jgi:hypothetical protein
MYTKEFVVCVVLYNEQLSLVSSEYYGNINIIDSYINLCIRASGLY